MSLVPTGRHILTPYRRLFNQVAPVVAYGLARDAYQLGRTYLHARAARPVTTHNTVSNPSSNRVTTRPSDMVRRGYKRRRSTRPSYRSKRRRTSRFRRRRFTRGNRFTRRIYRGRRSMNNCNYIKLFSRHSFTHTPAEIDNRLVLILTQSPTWTNLPHKAVAYSNIYEEWKPLKLISKYFVLQPALQLSTGSSKIQHWFVYDRDCQGRAFASATDFNIHPSVKWNFMTPFRVSTHRVKPTFRRFANTSSSGLRKLDNPWRPLTEWQDGVADPHQNHSGIQHLFISSLIQGQNPFTIIQQNVFTFILRGNNNGTTYAA